MHIHDEFESVFDNDKPVEMCCDDEHWFPLSQPSSPPPPREYHRQDVVINRPYSDKPCPKPYRPDYTVEAVKLDNSPNPVPNTYMVPGHKCHIPPHHHKPCPPPPPDRCLHPMEWEEDGRYVTKHELNHILSNIARADIYTDMSVNGTTASVGGIKKGTKFNRITFSKLVDMMLYSKNVSDDDEYICETPDGRTILNSIVKYPIGNLKEGDSIKGMSISQIIEAMLCEKNNWGIYRWVSDPITIDAGETTIDAEELIPYLVTDYRCGRTFELHVVGNDSVKEEEYNYEEIIAQLCSEQKTNVNVEGVPKDIKWSYNPESKKVTLHTDTEITSGITIVFVRR